MVEQVVRAQAAMRQRDHAEANASRKLTKEQRKEKAEAKLVEDTDLELTVVVFRVHSLKNGSHKFKVGHSLRLSFGYGAVAPRFWCVCGSGTAPRMHPGRLTRPRAGAPCRSTQTRGN
jgi:hypothetical protein